MVAMRPVENYMFETLSHFVDSKSWGVLPLGQRHEAAQLRAPSINVMKLVYRFFVVLKSPQTSARVFCFVCLLGRTSDERWGTNSAVRSLLAAGRW